MTTLTVSLSDEVIARLKRHASIQKQTIEEFVVEKIGQFAAELDPAFDQAAQHVLDKNAELYKRLA